MRHNKTALQEPCSRLTADLELAAIILYFYERPESRWYETSKEFINLTKPYTYEQLKDEIKRICTQPGSYEI